MPPYDARKEIEGLRNDVTAMKASLKELAENHFVHLEAKVDLLMEKVDGRPSWLVLMIISFLATTCGVLATALFKLVR